MAEPTKGSSSSANPKKKTSFIDEDIGDDFLSSWKSMSVMDDDKMDLSFDTGPKGKKEVFNFDKLDMDFNLDGDFNKISSFKIDMSDFDFSTPRKKDAKTKDVDMSDLDFSCKPKNSAKAKEVDMSDIDFSSSPRKAANTTDKSEQPSSGSRQGKHDHFKLSLDFNELDSFDLDSTLSRREKNSKKNQDKSKEIMSDTAGCERSKNDPAEGISTRDGESETFVTSKVDTVLFEPENSNSMDGCASKSESTGNLDLPPGPRCREKVTKESIEELNQPSQLPEKAMSTEPYADQAQDLPAELVGGVDSIGNAGVEGKNGGCHRIKTVNTIVREKAFNDTILVRDGPNSKDPSAQNSIPKDICSSRNSNGDKCMLHSDALAESDEPDKGDLKSGDTLVTLVLTKSEEIKNIMGSQKTTSKPPLFTQASESPADKVTLRIESGAGEICSEISKTPEDSEPQLYLPPLVGEKPLSPGIKNIGSMQLHPAIDKGVSFQPSNAQHGSDLLSAVFADRETKVRPGRDENGTKEVRKSLCDTKATERDPVLRIEQRKNHKDPRVQVSPSITAEKTIKPSIQSVNPKLMLPTVEPVRNSKITTFQRNKHLLVTPAQKKLDISTRKVSKNIGEKKASLNTGTEKEVKSLRSSEKNKELQGSERLETKQTVDGSEKMTQILPMKRKTFEGLNSAISSLKPLKRLTLSPRESRNFKEPSNGAVKEQVCILENHLENKTKSPTSRLGSPCTFNRMELENPLAMETDENVEKAEAYTKELDDICNMLKKKREEAKELLVRAVVNNSNLLMLNHPIYEAKFHKIQKFAAKLAS